MKKKKWYRIKFRAKRPCLEELQLKTYNKWEVRKIAEKQHPEFMVTTIEEIK